MKTGEVLRSLDWILLGTVLLLCAIGLASLFSSADTADLLSARFSRQVFSLGVGLIAAMLVVRVPYHTYRRYATLIYGIAFLGLVVVFLAGEVIRGTASRLEIGGFQLQPSEFMKIALVLILAWLFARFTTMGWRGVVISGALVAVPCILIVIEPDVGVASLLIALWAGLIVFVGLPWRHVIILLLLASLGLGAAWQWLLVEYQRDRLLVFLDPTRDPQGASYNVVQSIVALGSGRLFGRGLGHGPQSQLEFLPERHTDFILASIGEELGFVGVLVVLLLYTIMLWRILLIARNTQDIFGQILAAGTFLLLLISLMVSAGMNMGLLPVTGIPLPLLSYGGSNLLSTLVLLAMVQSVRVYSHWVRTPPTEITHLT